MRWGITILSVLAFSCAAAEGLQSPHKLKEVRSLASTAAAWRVLIKDDALDQKYTITDPKVIEKLANLIDSKDELSHNNTVLALSPHVYVDIVAKATSGKEGSSIKLEITGDWFTLLDRGEKFGATLKSEDLYNRLADQNFVFPAKE